MKNNINFSVFPDYIGYPISLSERFDAVAEWANSTITNATETEDSYLSFYPIAKNIRMVTSRATLALLNGRLPVVSERPRPSEEPFWREQTGQDWKPWLWTRGSHLEKLSNRSAWESLFSPLSEIAPARNKKRTAKLSIQRDEFLFLLYLVCLTSGFSPNDKTIKMLEDEGFLLTPRSNHTVPYISLQVRRGEVVPSTGDVNFALGNRKHHTLQQYLTALRLICERIGTNKVFVSSDAENTVDELSNMGTEFEFFTNPHDKSKFVRYSGSGKNHLLEWKSGNSTPPLEFAVAKDPTLAPFYLKSAISDLILLQGGIGYVGGMSTSEYGLLGWLLQMSYHRTIYPYYNLDGIFDTKSKQVGLILI